MKTIDVNKDFMLDVSEVDSGDFTRTLKQGKANKFAVGELIWRLPNNVKLQALLFLYSDSVDGGFFNRIIAHGFVSDEKSTLQRFAKKFDSCLLSVEQNKIDEFVEKYMIKPEQAVPILSVGSEYQRRIWKLLCDKIGWGETITYKGFAHQNNHDDSYNRAVAGAVAANSVAWLIPCHRVVHKDNKNIAYAWGTEVKRKLLAAEIN